MKEEILDSEHEKITSPRRFLWVPSTSIVIVRESLSSNLARSIVDS